MVRHTYRVNKSQARSINFEYGVGGQPHPQLKSLFGVGERDREGSIPCDKIKYIGKDSCKFNFTVQFLMVPQMWGGGGTSFYFNL